MVTAGARRRSARTMRKATSSRAWAGQRGPRTVVLRRRQAPRRAHAAGTAGNARRARRDPEASHHAGRGDGSRTPVGVPRADDRWPTDRAPGRRTAARALPPLRRRGARDRLARDSSAARLGLQPGAARRADAAGLPVLDAHARVASSRASWKPPGPSAWPRASTMRSPHSRESGARCSILRVRPRNGTSSRLAPRSTCPHGGVASRSSPGAAILDMRSATASWRWRAASLRGNRSLRRARHLAALRFSRSPAETPPCRLFHGSLDWLAGFASGRSPQNRPTGKHSSFSSVAQRQSIRLLTGGL